MWSGDCIGKTKVRNNMVILPHLEHHSSQCRGVAKSLITVCGFSALESSEVKFCKLEYLKCHSHNSLIFFHKILCPSQIKEWHISPCLHLLHRKWLWKKIAFTYKNSLSSFPHLCWENQLCIDYNYYLLLVG